MVAKNKTKARAAAKPIMKAGAAPSVATNFYRDVLMKSPIFKSTTPCRDPLMMEPGTRAAVLALIEDARKLGHELRISETYRSPARQHQLYMKGYSKLAKVGCHGYGVACDLALYVNGAYEEHAEPYKFLVDLCRKHGLISGYDWGTPRNKHSFMDAGHVQRIPVFRQGAMFSGTWYPPESYDPYKDQIDHHIPGA